MKQTNIYNFVSDDDFRPLMTGVFHDNGTAVASNAMVLLASTRDYNEKHNGKVIGKDDKEIAQTEKSHYPKWRAIMPQHYTGYYCTPFPMDSLRAAVKHASDYIKTAPKFAELLGKRKRVQRTTRVVVDCGEFIMAFSYEQAKKFCTLPSDGEVVECEDKRRAVWYRNKKEGYEALLMPIVIGDYEKDAAEALAKGVSNWQDQKGMLMPTVFVA